MDSNHKPTKPTLVLVCPTVIFPKDKVRNPLWIRGTLQPPADLQSFSHIKKTAVIDRRLRPRCCRLWSYLKHVIIVSLCKPTLERYMDKHDVINIQHAYCGVVGSDRGARKVGP